MATPTAYFTRGGADVFEPTPAAGGHRGEIQIDFTGSARNDVPGAELFTGSRS